LSIDNICPSKGSSDTKETLRNLPIYGFYRAPKNKQEAEEIINDLSEVLDSDIDKKFEKIDNLEKEKVFSTTFKNGKTYFLKRKEVPGDDGSKVKNIVISDDEYYFTIYLESGKEISVPWDFVLSLHQPKYEFYKSKEQRYISSVEIGKRVKRMRKMRNITQKELEKKTKIKRANIARIESGKHRPSLETLERIADALDVPVVNLVAIK